MTEVDREKPALTPDEVYVAWNGAVGRGTIRRLLRDGRLRSVRVGCHYRIPRSELVAFWEREAGK